jgi:hypothetical protein
MNGKFLLFGQDEIENSFMHLVDRSIREQRREERRLAERRATKHRFQARKSCVADARSYRIARRLPVLAVALFDWKNLIPIGRPLFGSAWLKKFRENQLKHWLSAKHAS